VTASGASWLLLRGLSREQRHWDGFPEVFASRVIGSRTFTLDFPGTGTEHRRATPANVPDIALDLRTRWLALRERVDGPWGLLAVSLGGMVAMEWCSAFPDDFSRLVLCNTSAANLSPPWKRMSLRVVPSVVRLLLSRDPVARERRILQITTRRLADVAPTARRWAGYQRDLPVTRVTVLRQLWAGLRYRAPARMQVPTLVLAGALDPLTHPDCPRTIAGHFAAPCEVHPSAGHDLATDDPTWVADRVQAWVAAPPTCGRA
jgi:pimeloyl-ACP methyl ester carboxylesterase